MKKNLTKILIIFLFIILFFKRSEVNDAVLIGINIWYQQLLPSLFPFFLFSDAFVSSGIVDDLSKRFGNLFAKIFKVSKYSFFIFFISLASGSPTNAKNIKNMLESGYILKEEAEKILCFTMFYNPFLIYSITSLYLTSEDALKIILVTYITNIIIGLILRYKKCRINNTLKENKKKILFVDSIKNTIFSLIGILGTIITMMIIITLLKTNNLILDNVFNGFLEITSGIINLCNLNISYNLKLILTIIYLSFGGISIHMQIKSILKDAISYKLFYQTRILAIVIGLLWIIWP